MKKSILLCVLTLCSTISCQIDNSSLDSPKEMVSDGGQSDIPNNNPLKSARVDPSNGRIFGNPASATGSCYNFDATGSSINSWCSECHHAGKDYCGSTSDDILAVGSGRVAYVSNAADGKSGSGDNRGFGRTIILAHKMPDKTNVYSLYAHLSSIASDITLGKYITKGYYLGKKGSSGGGANGVVHLHFEMKNNAVLGHTPDCSGSGCVGYVKKTLLPVTSRGYYNPNNYIAQKEFYDLVLDSTLPTTLNKSGVNIPVKINSPFLENSNIDIRLSLYDISGNYKGDIQSYNNLSLKSGSNTITFSKTSLTSSVGSYLLQLSYKVPNSSTWLSFPVWSTFTNPSKVTIK